MVQEIIVGLIFISASVFLVYRFFPALFGIKKANTGCGSCGDKVDIVKTVRKVSQDL